MSREYYAVVVPELDDKLNGLLKVDTASSPQTLRPYVAEALQRRPDSSKLTRREADLAESESLTSTPSPLLGPVPRSPADDAMRITCTASATGALYRQTYCDTVFHARADSLADDLFNSLDASFKSVWDSEDSSVIFHGPSSGTLPTKSPCLTTQTINPREMEILGTVVEDPGERLLQVKENSIYRRWEDNEGQLHQPLLEKTLRDLLAEAKARSASYYHVHLMVCAADIHGEVITQSKVQIGHEASKPMHHSLHSVVVNDICRNVVPMAATAESPHVYLGTSNGEHEDRNVPPPTGAGNTSFGSASQKSFVRRNSGVGRRRSSLGEGVCRISETKKKSDSYCLRQIRCVTIQKESDIDWFMRILSREKDPDAHLMVSIAVRQTCSMLPPRTGVIRLLDISQGMEISASDRDTMDNIISKLMSIEGDEMSHASKLIPGRHQGVRTFSNLLASTIQKPGTHLRCIAFACPSQFFNLIPHIAKCGGFNVNTMIDKTNHDVEQLLRSLWDERRQLEEEKMLLVDRLAELDAKVHEQFGDLENFSKEKNDLYAQSFRVKPEEVAAEPVGALAGSYTDYYGTMTMREMSDAMPVEGKEDSLGETPGEEHFSLKATPQQHPLTSPAERSSSGTGVRRKVVQLLSGDESSMPLSESPILRRAISPVSPTILAEEEFYCEKYGFPLPVESREVAKRVRQIGRQLESEEKTVEKNQKELDHQLATARNELTKVRSEGKHLVAAIEEIKGEIFAVKSNDALVRERQEQWLEMECRRFMSSEPRVESRDAPAIEHAADKDELQRHRELYREKVRRHLQQLSKKLQETGGAVTEEYQDRYEILAAAQHTKSAHDEHREYLMRRIEEEKSQVAALEHDLDYFSKRPEEQLHRVAAQYDYCRHLWQVLTQYLEVYPQLRDRVTLRVPLPAHDPLQHLLVHCRGVPQDVADYTDAVDDAAGHELLLGEIRRAAVELRESQNETAATGERDAIWPQDRKSRVAAALRSRDNQQFALDSITFMPYKRSVVGSSRSTEAKARSVAMIPCPTSSAPIKVPVAPKTARDDIVRARKRNEELQRAVLSARR